MKPALPKVFSRAEDSSLSARIETDQLTIRSINESDRRDVISLQSNKEVMKFVASGKPRSPERIDRIHSNLLSLWKKGNPIGGYAICNKEGIFVGMACLEEVKEVKER